MQNGHLTTTIVHISGATLACKFLTVRNNSSSSSSN